MQLELPGGKRVAHRVRGLRVVAAASLALCACQPTVEGSAVPNSPAGIGSASNLPPSTVVILSAVNIPPGATDLGVVQAHSPNGTIDLIIPEFVNQVMRLGGNFGKIDDVSTRFETITYPVTHTYSCGTATAPMTCTSTTMQTREVATTRILGRAFRTLQ